jgi:hypothetical protein
MAFDQPPGPGLDLTDPGLHAVAAGMSTTARWVLIIVAFFALMIYLASQTTMSGP